MSGDWSSDVCSSDLLLFGLKICHEQIYAISVRGDGVFIAIPDTWKVSSHKFTHKRYKAWILGFNPHLPAPPFHKPEKGDPNL